MSYCTADQVADIARTWTEGGEFLDTDYTAGTVASVPSLAAVERWIDGLSSNMDLALAQHWFVTPVADTSAAYAAISLYVARVVADLVAETKGQGRFATDAFTVRGRSIQGTIDAEMKQWVADHADGFLAAGLAQLQKTAKKNSVRIQSLYNPDL